MAKNPGDSKPEAVLEEGVRGRERGRGKKKTGVCLCGR